MARLPRLSRTRAPKPKDAKVKAGASKPNKQKGRGGKAFATMAGLSLLDGLLGGSGGRSSSNGTKIGGAGLAGQGRRGKANYGPLPAFSVSTKPVKKYTNPTLATISLQMGQLIQSMGLIESNLKSQFALQQFEYKENAKVQREINAESSSAIPISAANDNGGSLGSASLTGVSQIFGAFNAALEDAIDALNNMSGGSGLPIPVPIPGGGGGGGKGRPEPGGPAARNAKLVEAGKPSRFVAKAEAFDKKGNLKPGYEPVRAKETGRVTGYRKMAGSLGERTRRVGSYSPLLGRVAERVGGGINAASSFAQRAVVNPASNLLSRSSQFVKNTATRLSTSVSSSPITQRMGGLVKRGISALKTGGQAIGGVVKAVGRFALTKGLTIAFIAYEVWNAYQEIKALPANLTPRQRKNQIAKIVGRVVGSIGLFWAGAAFGALVGTAVFPGPGTLVGFLGGLVGGLVADYAFGNSVDELVEYIIDALYPADKAEDARPVPKAKPDTPVVTPMAATTPSQGQAAYSKPPATGKLKKALTDGDSNMLVGAALDQAATKAGVDPALLRTIAYEQPSFDPNKTISTVTGQELFKLTPSQWSQTTSKYGSQFPELYSGISDPKAASLAAALLLKDATAFLASNNLPVTPVTTYGSFLLGNEGIQKLLTSSPDMIASSVLPEAASRRPELFTNDQNKPISTGELAQKLYNTTLTAQERAATGAGDSPKIQQQPTLSGTTPDMGTTPNADTGATEGANTPSPSMTPEGSTPAPDATASTPAPDATASTSMSSTPDADAMATSGPAAPVPAAPSTGTAIATATNEAEIAADKSVATLVNETPSVPLNKPMIMPSTNSGSNGSGVVPSPYIFLASVVPSLYYGNSVAKASSGASVGSMA